MNRIAAIAAAVVVAAVVVAAPAAARPRVCSAVQPLTVVNRAQVRPLALARVERAFTDQAVQLSATWGTPCVTFAPGGWPIYLGAGPKGSPCQAGPSTIYCAHVATQVAPGTGAGWARDRGAPYAVVWTAHASWRRWSYFFSHEVIEMLVDPYFDTFVSAGEIVHPQYPEPLPVVQPAEVCDAIELLNDGFRYRLDGVWLARFQTPVVYAAAAAAGGI